MSKIEKIKNIFTPTRMIVLGFAGIIFVGAFLLCLPIAHNNNQWFPFIDGLFTATSAVCVTGLVVVDTAINFSLFGQIVILILIQVGGLGVMTATTLLFMMMRKKITLKNRLLMQEALAEDKLQGVVRSIRKILMITFVIELIGALILMCRFIPEYGGYGAWVSVFISISAFCNAGFDILGVLEGGEYISLMPFVGDAVICLTVMSLIVIGGIGFMVLTDVGQCVIKRKGQRKRLSINTKIVLVTTILLIVAGWMMFLATEWGGELKDYDVGTKILASLFQSITPRTAGFNTIDQSTLTPASYMLTLILMFIGASPSSTGGGIKTVTLAILLITGFRTLQGHKDVNLKRSKINPMNIRKALTIVLMAMTLIFMNSFLILVLEANNPNITMENVLFEVTSAFSTVGLSMGITPEFNAASKAILCWTMFIGRVGALTVGFSLIKNKKDIMGKIEYTDARIILG